MGGQVYGLHPAMTGLHSLWNEGKMAVVCNVGSLVQPMTRATYQSGAPRPYQLFSHSDQQEQFRTAISSYRSSTGWGGRTADRTIPLNTGGAIPMITSIAGANVFNIGANTAPLIVAAAPTPAQSGTDAHRLRNDGGRDDASCRVRLNSHARSQLHDDPGDERAHPTGG